MIDFLKNFSLRFPWVHDFFHWLGNNFRQIFLDLGAFSFFAAKAFRWTFQGLFHVRVWVEQMMKIGVSSTPIVALVGLFSGMVFALQTGQAFKLFNAESLVGSTVGVALARELAPVFTALMIVARAGSGMAAEIGTMRVTEQIDALESMAVSPINYLVVPRLWATTLMMPLLVMIFNGLGLLGSYVVSVFLLEFCEGVYFFCYRYIVDPDDFYQGIIKAVFFGIALSLIACYQGYSTRGGAEGVGKATTKAVVYGSVCVLVMNYFLAIWLIEWFRY
ncbi:MAG: ABC transporter permease [Deltaproteobacteria bacterium]|nr:ABC transporter permease [Deltaproteobacteria bacterium]